MHTDPVHDALCRRCGRCCYEKFIVDDCVFTTRRPCAHLDTRTNLCRVYERRHATNQRCLTVEQGIEYGVFPADCPYVRGLSDYHPAEEGWLDERAARQVERGALLTADDVRKAMKRGAPCASHRP